MDRGGPVDDSSHHERALPLPDIGFSYGSSRRTKHLADRRAPASRSAIASAIAKHRDALPMTREGGLLC